MVLTITVFGIPTFAKTITSSDLKKLRLPSGLSISIVTADAAGARSLAKSNKGTLFVGTKEEGKVYALRRQNKTGFSVITFASGLNEPNGVAFKDGDLYVAEINRILKFEKIDAQLDKTFSDKKLGDKKPAGPSVATDNIKLKFKVIYDKLPKDEHHGWKFIAFGPDGYLYVPIGAPCNVCDPQLPYATINRIKPDGTGFEMFARGIRNSVGFDWQPVTHELWFDENGRDMLGDDLPPDELNNAPKSGLHFGYPYCYGAAGKDPEFGKNADCGKYQKPEVEYPAHVAPLGLRFYTGSMFGPEYKNQIFAAQHGSWNRSKPIGYQVVSVIKKSDGHFETKPFVEGWLGADDQVWGRPVDVLVDDDGSLLISDDFAGAIYRVTKP